MSRRAGGCTSSRRAAGWLFGVLAWAHLSAGCAQHVPGVRVDFDAVRRGEAPDGGLPALRDGAGHRVTLRRAVLVVTSLQLHPCGEAADAGSEMAWLSQWFGVPVARAHGMGSPTRLAVPHVLDLSGPGPWPLGALEPPTGRYCAVTVTLGPADADAEGLADAAGALGRSLWLEGQWEDGSGNGRDLRTVSGRRLSRRLPLPDGGMLLDGAHRSARIEVRFEPDQWLAGLDLSDADPATASQAVLQAVVASMRLDVR